ncbi:T9SS type A sorting domain-containing protein [candidate division KSB1 bacterium]|nr:T9SS type A sorting domain-containing protein [candidate division KSB1 bacterium]
MINKKFYIQLYIILLTGFHLLFAANWIRNDYLLNYSGVQSYGEAKCETGDIDGDSLPDLIVIDSLGLRCYKNLSNDSVFRFERQPDWENISLKSKSSYNEKPTLVDLNGDHLADLLIPDDQSQMIRFWINSGQNGTRWITADSVFENVKGRQFFACGDLDRDNDYDGLTYINSTLYIYWNTGNATLPRWENNSSKISQEDFINLGGGLENIRFHDINNDGYEDFIGAYDWGGPHDSGAMVRIGLNKGLSDSLLFSFPEYTQILTFESFGVTVSIGDMNNDGALELITTHGVPFINLWNFEYTSERVNYSHLCNLGIPFGFLGTGMAFWKKGNQKNIILAHVDRPTDVWDQRVRLYFYYEENHLWKPRDQFGISTELWDFQNDPAISVFDWNNDNDHDLALGTHDGMLSFLKSIDDKHWENDLSLFAQFSADSLFYNPVLFDFNNNDQLDLLIQESGHYFIYENTATDIAPNWEKRADLSVNLCADPHYKAAIGDVNRDGLPDVLFGEYDGTLRLYVNTGTTQLPQWLEDSDEFAQVSISGKVSPLLYDLDDDGDMDLVLGDSHGLFTVYMNDTKDEIEQKAEVSLPSGFSLLQNYPNPFNSSTTIQFELPKEQLVTVSVYNTLGQQIEVIISKMLPKGLHKIKWRPGQQSSGLYFIVLQSEHNHEKIKTLFIK